MMSNKILTEDEFPFLFEDYDGERYDVHHVYRDTNRLTKFDFIYYNVTSYSF